MFEQVSSRFRNFLNSAKLRFSSSAEVLEKLEKHIEALAKEVTFINHYSDIRKVFYMIVDRSPIGNKQNIFWTFIHQTFAHELIIRLSRLLDRQFSDPGQYVYSLIALLLELRRKPWILSREHYVGISPCTKEQWILTTKHRFPNGEADMFFFYRLMEEFDEMAGAGISHYSKKNINRDIDQLKKTTKVLRLYRNKILAHNAIDSELPQPLTFGDITNAIRIVNEITHKYFLLIKRGTHTLDVGDHNITSLFLEPWISSKEIAKAILDEFKATKKKERESIP